MERTKIIIFFVLLILLFSCIVNADEKGKSMKKIHTIFERTEGVLGVDDERNLYWNNKAIVTEQKVKLEWWVNVSIIVASVSTFAIAFFTYLQFWYKVD